MSSSVQMFHQNAEEKSARKMQKWSGESKALFKEDGEDDPIAENGQKGLHLDRPDRWSWGWRCGSSRWSWRQSHGRSRHPGRTWPSRSCLPQGSSRPRTSPVEFPAPGPPPLRPPQPSEPSKNQASPVSLSLSLSVTLSLKMDESVKGRDIWAQSYRLTLANCGCGDAAVLMSCGLRWFEERKRRKRGRRWRELWNGWNGTEEKGNRTGQSNPRFGLVQIFEFKEGEPCKTQRHPARQE